jgi:transposase
MRRALSWAANRTGGDLDALWVFEGAASYGARPAGSVAAGGYPVAETGRMNARGNRGVGKSDPIDARRIAAAVLPLDVDELRRQRLDEGTRAVLQVLVTARESITAERTRAINALTAGVSSPLTTRSKRTLTARGSGSRSAQPHHC